MNIFSKIWGFLKSFFSRARPGLEGFIQKYQQLAEDEVWKLFQSHDGAGLHLWWDTAFAAVKAQVIKDLPQVADNWISLLVTMAYEVIKNRLPK